jgi:Ca-activated chloride channel family protein
MKLQLIRGRGTAAIVPLIAGLLSAFDASADAGRTHPVGGATWAQFSSGVDLVEVYATVTDPQGEPVKGLTAADFRLSEDGMPQSITTFAAGEFPLSVAIALDRSFSMGGGKTNLLAGAKTAARAFIDALGPSDQVMVVAIGSDTEVTVPLTTDRAAAESAIDRLDAWGTTPLYDATLAAIDAIQAGKGRRALVLLSDGTDRYSDTTAAVLLEKARRRDVLIYPVAIGSKRPPVFAELAAATGGRSFFVPDPKDLARTLTAIAHELRSQYLLGYAPARAQTRHEEWHAIEVTVQRPDVRVRAREGYAGR